MEKLADAFCFRIPGYGVHSYKSNAHKTGLGGQVAGKPDGPHSPAVCVEGQAAAKMVLGFLGGEGHIVVQRKHLLLKRGIVRENSHRIFIYKKAAFCGFHSNGLGFICDDPVELC